MGKLKHPPKAFPIDREPGRGHWRNRWVVLKSWRVLHRVSEIEYDAEEIADDHLVNGEGVTVCGERGLLTMPGIFSRMGLKRCPRCCKLLNLPQGYGMPFNANIPEPDDGDYWAVRIMEMG